MNRLSFIAALAVAAAATAGPLYKWVDQSGVHHFTDTPPPPGAARRLETLETPEPARQATKPESTDWKRLDDELRVRLHARQEQEDGRRWMQRHQEELAELQKSAPVPGETRASVPLQRDLLGLLLLVDSEADKRCFQHQVVNTELSREDAAPVKWVEMWTLLRCGKRVRFRIAFSPAAKGGMLFSIQTPGQELP